MLKSHVNDDVCHIGIARPVDTFFYEIKVVRVTIWRPVEFI